ncbi:glycosyltransferase family 4 protein [Paenibacillus barcinonensis]|uniref:Glycosyltransferase family 4 protein n=1 Tax=Paenibacillus barcinonensis TaxID=198119 RepID=A0A2V4WP25_PAEBA|nr:glycosyltransferase family 4 protein [Paenibacillus barcinonensis]PYE49602.1 spore coat protein SA [Paenibacillus barcinonensis]QKS56682.1 glycosyltransferase family 4 protein [Paenibacillus barcinonensis]
MHIVMIAPEKLPLPGNGSVEICILSIARELARRHQITIISRSMKGSPSIEHMDQITIRRVSATSVNDYTTSVIRLLSTLEMDVIQVDNRPLSMAAIKKTFPQIPVVLYLHSLTFVQPGPRKMAALRKASCIAVNSQSLKHKLCQRFPAVKPRLHVVPLGTDIERFRPAINREEQLRIRASVGLTDDFTVLYAGRVIPGKGVDVLIRAVALLQKHLTVQLVIAGKGPLQFIRYLRKLARKYNVRVILLGQMKHEQIDQLYRSVDCLVCPSQKHEAFGLVNVEAMASGIPVVASDNGGIREIIQTGKNGYLISSYRQPQSFASSLYQLASSPALAQALGKCGRETAAAQFSWARTAMHLEAVYTRLIRR